MSIPKKDFNFTLELVLFISLIFLLLGLLFWEKIGSNFEYIKQTLESLTEEKNDFLSIFNVRNIPKKLNNGLYGGNIKHIIIDQKQTNNLYVITPDEIYKSVDSGNKWYNISKNIISPKKIYIDPDNSRFLYMVSSTGIYKSTNNGNQWLWFSNNLKQNIVKDIYTTSFENKKIIFALTRSPKMKDIKGKTEDNLFKSVDNGNKWEIILRDVGEILSFSISNKQTLYALTTKKGFIKSMDLGKKWKEINKGLPPNFIGSLFYGDSSKLYLLIKNSIYTITDDIDKWKFVRDFQTDKYTLNDLIKKQKLKKDIIKILTPIMNKKFESKEGLKNFINNLKISLIQKNSLFKLLKEKYFKINYFYVDSNDVFYVISNNKIFRSVNKGWEEIKIKLPHQNINTIVCDPKKPEIIYVGTESGLFKSVDNGNNWIEINNGIEAVGVKFFNYESKNNIIYVGTKANGLYKIIDKRNYWEIIGFKNKQIYDFDYSPQNYENLFVATEIGLFKSIDRGKTWKKINFNSIIKNIEIDPLNSNNIYVASENNIFKSIDKGKTWKSIKGLNIKILDLKIDKNKPETLYVCSSKDIFKSNNKGETWSNISKKIPFKDNFNKIFINPYKESIYIVSKNNLFVSDGNNWNTLKNLKNINCLEFSKKSPFIIYAGGSKVYKSFDNGNTWKEFVNFDSEITSLLLSQESTLYIGTKGKGIMKIN